MSKRFFKKISFFLGNNDANQYYDNTSGKLFKVRNTV